ncbi:MAG: MATE family efflux transporter [Lachnospiraceae bacterium]|nr:MATE family efflux transporter [Lachnospiraceae bacterium]
MTSLVPTLSKEREVSIRKSFGKYVSQNIFAMIGISCYVLVDTFFIAQVQGSDGITILNLCLPIYNFIAAIGSMIGVGSAIEFAVGKAARRKDKDMFFTNAVYFALIFGFTVMALGLLVPKQILYIMGADKRMATLGAVYIRTFMFFGPTSVLNQTVNAFVRNDGEPGLAMFSTIVGSLFNIVFDYIFMYPMHLGMFGAALATAFSPVVEILICLKHFKRADNEIKLIRMLPSFKKIIGACKVGVSSFIGEFASGITTTIFNYMILSIAGNIGVASYGVIANLAIVFVAIFNGVSNGNQPLISKSYGQGKKEEYSYLLKLGIKFALFIAVISYIIVIVLSDQIVFMFNSNGSKELYDYAKVGLFIYFIGFIFSGLNCVIAGFFSATKNPIPALIISLSRGVLLIGVCAVLLGTLFGMNGVWASYPVAEGITFLISASFLINHYRHN